MGGIEAGLVVLVILFYIVRALFRGLKRVVQAVRRTVTPRPTEQVAAPPPSQPVRQPMQVARPRQVPGGRRPEAGGPAVAETATGPQFRAQVARLESEEEARRPAPGPSEDGVPSPAPARLLEGPDDLLRAVIMQEVLAKPLSQRRRAPRPMPPPH